MTSLVEVGDVVRGAAVVVDDRIDEPEGALKSILEQLRDAEIPTILHRELPSHESLIHWKQFGLIVLDWELSYSTADDSDEVEIGITVPSGLAETQRAEVTNFVRHLLAETSLPIFVASNANVDDIRSHLESALPEFHVALNERVRVYSKSELEISLFATIAEWLASRPALVALRAWNRAYVDAEISTFQHLMESEEDWVAAVHRAADADGVEVGEALRDMLARNIVSRVIPLELNLSTPSTTSMTDASSLRHAMHLSAVIPGSALTKSGLGTGDLFVTEDATEPYRQIRILLTPECDLVRTGEPRLTHIPANLNLKNQAKTSVKRVNEVRNGSRGNLAICVLTPSGHEYQIPLKAWESSRVEVTLAGDPSVAGAASSDFDANHAWPGFRRIGRLMEPYISHIQQHFSGETTRKGLPRIPDDFFEGWTKTELPEDAAEQRSQARSITN